MDYAAIARVVVALMDIPQPWVLSLDLTKWQFGGCTFNILMLGVVNERVAFPLVGNNSSRFCLGLKPS